MQKRTIFTLLFMAFVAMTFLTLSMAREKKPGTRRQSAVKVEQRQSDHSKKVVLPKTEQVKTVTQNTGERKVKVNKHLKVDSVLK